MTCLGPDGKIHYPDGTWWSPYGNTDAEIRQNMNTGKMQNAPGAIRVGPKYFTGSKKGDIIALDMLGNIGALAGPAKAQYEARKRGQFVHPKRKKK